jgi:hypothetical protein
MKVGDIVGFKYDVEQTGRIVEKDGNSITVEARDGGYVHSGCRSYDDDGDCECGRMILVDFLTSEVWELKK